MTNGRRRKQGNQGQRTDKDVPKVLQGLREDVDPTLDMEKMSEDEKMLFRALVQTSLEKMNDQIPLQRAKQMQHWIRSSLQSALYIAGAAITEYRALNQDLESYHSE